MKFFKHFVDAHRGQSLQLLRKRHGWAANGKYWAFVELCAEKLVKEAQEEFTEAHCKFTFAKDYLRSSLGFGNLQQMLTFLQALADLDLSSFEDKGDVVLCSMPKLLEALDRDTNRARIERDESAPKNKKKSKEKDIRKAVEANPEIFNEIQKAVG